MLKNFNCISNIWLKGMPKNEEKIRENRNSFYGLFKSDFPECHIFPIEDIYLLLWAKMQVLQNKPIFYSGKLFFLHLD